MMQPEKVKDKSSKQFCDYPGYCQSDHRMALRKTSGAEM